MPPILLLVTLLLLVSSPARPSSAAEITVGSHPASVVLPRGEVIEGSPGSRASAKLVFNRVHIRGYSRLHHLSKYANALKIGLSVSEGDGTVRPQAIELCLHRNASIEVGMCPASRWQKISKNYWGQSISPYEHRILDIRMPPDSSRTVEVTTSEEFLLHRVIFLIVGVIMMLLAHALSESLVFYYGGAMTIGVFLVVLIVLFQGMKLLPTGRSFLAIFMYSSAVGVGTFLLQYLSGFVKSLLVEIGIDEDLHIPLGTFLLVGLLLVGAWFGYWSVHKLVLTEEGLIDSSVAYFVEWAILIISAVAILQSSLDMILSSMALALSFVVLALSRTEGALRLLRRIFRRTFKTAKRTVEKLSPSKYSYSQYSSMLHSPETDNGSLYKSYPRRASYRSPPSGLRSPLQKPSGVETYYSSFHDTPERRKFSKEEWDSFTKEHTDRGIKELVSSPEFSKWALENADRISVTPRDKTSSQMKQQRRFFSWF